jgi:LysM repeat protein
MTHLRARALGLVASVTIVLLLVAAPAALIAIGAAPWDVDLARVARLLGAPDDGRLAMGVVAVIAWLAWVVLAVSLATEILARLRGVRAPHLAGLTVPQEAAGRLVAVASLLFVAVPAVTPLLALPPAHGVTQTSAHTEAATVAQVVAPTTQPPSPAPATTPLAGPDVDTVDYTVKRGDTLWRIAEQRLGDGLRFRELVDLNRDVLGGRPDFILPGTVLHLPKGVDDPGPVEDETYVVQPGDTLPEVAQAELGDPMRYPDIFDASRDTLQANGQRLTDPDLILPGWRLSIPGEQATDRPAVDEEDEQPEEQKTPPSTQETAPEPTPSAPTAEATPEVQAPTQVDDPADSDADEAVPGWILPGLTGAGVVLAGSLWLALRARRRTQLRYRRPGHLIAPPPPELRDVEKTAHTNGAPVAGAIESLDRLLRCLAADLEQGGEPLPELITAELANATVTLRLSAPADLPAPWEGAGAEWVVHLNDKTEDVDQVPPYPMLVTIGQSADGHLWLANLQALGTVALTGDADRAQSLGRHIAAELVLNPWSSLVDVDLLGLGEELASLDALRLHLHAPDDTAFLTRFGEELQAAANTSQAETFHALLTDASRGPSEVQLKVVAARIRNAGAALVAVNGRDLPDAVVLRLQSDGTVPAEALGVELMAAGLATEEASACAAIVDLTRKTAEAPAPIEGEPEDERRAVADRLGVLREELTKPRGEGPAGEESLLPLSGPVYADAAATTVEEIQEIAPVATPEARRRFEQADQRLDTDVAAWFNPDCPLPKLTVLGTVGARTHGDPRVVASRKPLAVELLAYLVLHPHGVTSDQIAADIVLSKNRVRVDLTAVRAWLGNNPRIGRPHLPPSNQTRAAQAHGGWLYQVDDVLVDADLFRRLRARGQARGSAGISDLQTALRLVSGQPFSDLRPGGWGWLLEGDRVDEQLTCAIADVAHILATHGLAEDDVPTAREAVETGRLAAPYDEVLRLDLVAVTVAECHPEVAKRMLIDDVCNRADDDRGPVDLPDRTAELIARKEWLGPRRTSG